MGEYSQAVFGRTRLPPRAIIHAGVYFPARKEAFRRCFDRWEGIKGNWIRYSFARLGQREYVILFGVYGAAMMLEAVQLLREGGVKSMYMTGSMYAKKLSVGAIVIPTSLVDKAGIVAVDNEDTRVDRPDRAVLEATRQELGARGIEYVEGKVASLPSVLHGIEHLNSWVKEESEIMGQDMEGSTFHHFTTKYSIAAGALFYVSDNDRHSIIGGGQSVWRARRKALRTVAAVAVSVMSKF